MNTFGKAERLCKRLLIEKLFSHRSSSFNVFPLRVICLPTDETDVPVTLLISVSKRHFKRAVKRNRVKRQLREAYRKHKDILAATGKHYLMAFIYQSDDLYPSDQIEEAVVKVLKRVGEEVVQ